MEGGEEKGRGGRVPHVLVYSDIVTVCRWRRRGSGRRERKREGREGSSCTSIQ